MYYIIIFLLTLIYLFFFSKSKDAVVRFFFMINIFIILYIIPASQYGIGTDYINYYNMVGDYNYINYLYDKKEYLFYFILNVIDYFKFEPQVFFAVCAFFQIFLLLNIIRILNRNLISVFYFFIGFFLVTNIYHNQMNHIRSYIAVLFFINSFFYRVEKKWFKMLLLLSFSLISHTTALLVLPLLFINKKLVSLVIEKPYSSLIFVTFIYMTLFNANSLVFLINNFVPSYSGYISRMDDSSMSIGELITRLYYFPLILYFIFKLKNKIKDFNEFNKYMYSTFLITSTSYFLLLNSSMFVRFWEYVVIFYAIAIAQLLKNESRNIKILIVLYLFVPYFMKVVIFPVREFDFNLILF